MRTLFAVACLLAAPFAAASEPVALGGPWNDVWMMAADGNWQGTGQADPDALKAVPNDAMLALAGQTLVDTPERVHALVSIGRRRAEGAVAVLAAALQPVEAPSVREAAVAGLLEHGGAEALPILRRALMHDPSAFVRGNSLWALCSWGPTEATAAVQQGLTDADPYVRGMAVLAVRALPADKGVVLPILSDAARAEHQQEWQEGLLMLSEAGWPEAGGLLHQFATASGAKDDPRTRRAVVAYRQWLRNFPELRPTE